MILILCFRNTCTCINCKLLHVVHADSIHRNANYNYGRHGQRRKSYVKRSIIRIEQVIWVNGFHMLGMINDFFEGEKLLVEG